MTDLEIKTEPEQKQESKQENQNNMETTQTTPETSEYRLKHEQIDWETMNNLGLGKERLEKMNLLDFLSKGYKTNELVPVSVNLDGAIVRTDARLSLQTNQEGKVVAAVHTLGQKHCFESMSCCVKGYFLLCNNLCFLN